MIYSEDDIPKVVKDRFYAAIQAVNDDCVDNYRFANDDDRESLGHYDALLLDGCCGFHDETVEVNGVRWYFGFNYGH
jgi:hypothetical protein